MKTPNYPLVLFVLSGIIKTLTGTSLRNPQVNNGKYVTLTRRDDGTYRPNFKPIRIGPKFNAVSFAVNVSNELLWALEGLVEEE